MTTQQIRESFNMVKNPFTTEYCQCLIKFLTFIKAHETTVVSLESVSIDGHAQVLTNFQLESAYRRKFPEKAVPTVPDMQGELEVAEAVKISFKIATGNYSFCTPVNNKYYYEVCRVMGIPFDDGADKKEVLHSFVTYPTLLENIKTAAGFVGTDKFRPQFHCVMLKFTGDGVSAVSTDSRMLFESRAISFEGTIKDFQIFISPEGLKALKGIKTDHGNPLNMRVFAGNTISINGTEIATMEGVSFPDYKSIMTSRDGCMEFDKNVLTKKIKYVLPCANKYVNQVLLHLNGTIDIKAEDKDFEFEASATTPYISKNFADMDMAFNGKLLIKCLSSLKGKKLKMHSSGSPTSPVLLTNDADNILLMPMTKTR